MEIAVVFESFVRAGSQRHLLEILKGICLFRTDLSCTLFIIAPISDEWTTFIPEVEAIGVPVVFIPYVTDRLSSADSYSRIYNWFSRNYRERSLNVSFYRKLHAFDFVVCAQPYVADLLLPHIKQSQRLCFHLMEHFAQRIDPWNYRLIQSRNLNLIYMHDSQIAQMPSFRNPNLSITWPVRVCPDHLCNDSSFLKVPSGTLCITHYSRISPMRLIDRIIDAFALLCKQTRSVLRIAGFIEDQDYLETLLLQVRHLGLSDVVHFVDPVPSPAEDPSRPDVDLVWMISLSGHIGYAGIEAMAAGFPTLFLEVDSRAISCPSDPQLSDLVCATPNQLVGRTLAYYDDPTTFRQKQAQLVRERFITTKEAIDELTAFYLGSA